MKVTQITVSRKIADGNYGNRGVVLILVFLAFLGTGCGSALSMFKFADLSPDLSGVVSSPVEAIENGGVKFTLTQIIEGDHPAGVDREVRIYSPDWVAWAHGNLAPMQRVELEGTWVAASGPAYFSASKLSNRKTMSADWKKVLGAKLIDLAKGYVGLSTKTAHVAVVEPDPVILKPQAKIDKLELPEPDQCEEVWELLEQYRRDGKAEEAATLVQLCFK